MRARTAVEVLSRSFATTNRSLVQLNVCKFKKKYLKKPNNKNNTQYNNTQYNNTIWTQEQYTKTLNPIEPNRKLTRRYMIVWAKILNLRQMNSSTRNGFSKMLFFRNFKYYIGLSMLFLLIRRQRLFRKGSQSQLGFWAKGWVLIHNDKHNQALEQIWRFKIRGSLRHPCRLVLIWSTSDSRISTKRHLWLR